MVPTIVVSGALANKCGNGGDAWVWLSWVRGFQGLGCDVYYVEEIDERACVDARGMVAPLAESSNWSWFHKITSTFGLKACSALFCPQTGACEGLSREELLAVAQRADLLVNISGNLRDAQLLRYFARRAYVDLDPGFTQFWHEQGLIDGLWEHDLHLTVGENIGTAQCSIPSAGVRWQPIRQPVLLEDWPMLKTAGQERRGFTTVATWRCPFGPVEHDGHRYGLKVHEFRKLAELPMVAGEKLEIAVTMDGADSADAQRMRRGGWRLSRAADVAADPHSFRRFVQESAGEVSAAQGVYVETASGWFSDRTIRYLASGKPAIVQDTGFSETYPVGEGLLAFRTCTEAASALRRVRADYEHHRRAARKVAEELFDSRRVLSHVLDLAVVAAPA